MNNWQATFLGLKQLPRELSGFEIVGAASWDWRNFKAHDNIIRAMNSDPSQLPSSVD
jgi:hypothetical protein